MSKVLAIREQDLQWLPLKDVPGFGGADIKGVYGKHFGDSKEGPWFYIIKHDPGAVVGRHTHKGNVIHYIMEGSWYLGPNKQLCTPGWFHYEQVGLTYGPIVAGENGVTFLTIYDEEPDFLPR